MIAPIGRLSCGSPATVARNSTRDSIFEIDTVVFGTVSCDSEREGSEVCGFRVFQEWILRDQVFRGLRYDRRIDSVI